MLTLESERLKRDTTLRQDLALKIDAEANTANEVCLLQTKAH